jgi:hypothetical protein
MSFIQNLFSSRDNNATGNTFVGQQDRIWWNPDTNAFYYSDGVTPGGVLITGGQSGNGTVGGTNTMVQFNNAGNFAGNANFTYNNVTSTLYVNNIVANTIGGNAGPAGPQYAVQINAGNGQFTGTSDFTYDLANGAAIVGNLLVGNVYPLANNVSSLGSPTQRFNSIWLGSGDINLIDETLNINQQINAQNGNLVITGGNGLVFGQFAMFENQIQTLDGAANITIGKITDDAYLDVNRPLAVNSTGGGAPAFTVEKTGVVEIKTYGNVAANTAALLINGTATGNDQPRNFGGSMIQVTAQDNNPARMSADAFGVDGSGQNAYASWASRVARGNVDTPSQTLAGDTMFRFTSQGYSNSGAYIGSVIRYNQVALENFATGKAGTRHNFAVAPVGSATIKNIANIDAQGLTFSSVATGGPANIGITFQDGTYQNTAYVATSIVNSLTAAAGITLSASTGNITVGTTAVLGVTGTTNQINVANVGNILTLSLPQNLNTTANIQLNQLTVNDLIILGNVSNVIPSVVGGKIIYVANTATNFAGIDVSGLVTGNAANGVYAGMLYNTTSNTWQMDIGNSNGITSDQIYATEITANGNIHLGNAYNDYDFPNALLQGDVNVDTYGQFVLKNHSQTANASADFVAVANNGDDTGYYIDMGMNSNVYANVDYAVTGANDGYLYVNGGNLVIGTQTAAKVIKFFTDGTDNVSNVRLTISSSGITAPGNITGNYVIANTAAIGGTVSATGNVIGGNLNIPAGLISAAGNITGLNVNTTILSATGNIRGGNINTAGVVSATANVVGGNLTTGAQVVATGNITGGNIITGGAVSAVGAISATGNVTGGNVNTGGNVTVSGLISAVGNIVTSANIVTANTVINSRISTSGNIIGANISTGGLITSTGNITGGNLIGQNLTAGRVAIVGSGKEVSDDADFTYNATTNVLSVAGNVNAANFNGNIVSTGNISTTANVIAGYGIFSAGNTVINAGISTTGNVTGNYFLGNGSQLTGTVGGSRYYGQFWDTTTQNNGGATTANPMTFNTSDAFNTGVSITVGNTSQVVIANPGVYNLQFSAQFAKTDSGQDTVSVWLAKDGVNVPDSCSDLDLNNNNARSIAAWNWLVNPTVANTYYQIYWSSSDTNMSIFAEGTRINPTRPAIPSVILTVTQA